MTMKKNTRGGKRPGAGRPAGKADMPDADRALTRGLSMTRAEWDAVDTEAAAKGVRVSAVIREQLYDFFHQKIF